MLCIGIIHAAYVGCSKHSQVNHGKYVCTLVASATLTAKGIRVSMLLLVIDLFVLV